MTTTSLSLTRRFSIYESVMIRVFSKLPKGSMRIQWPDGYELYFGEGNEVKATIRITDTVFFNKCVWYGDIGFAESYMDGDWQTDSLKDVISWFILNIEFNPILAGKGLRRLTGNFLKFVNTMYHSSRKNTLEGSRRNISEHYDLGNDFYQLFLDKTMTYSSAIFKTPEFTLEEAQVEKYDRLCRQLNLTPGDHLLEIGSGWGGMAKHAATHYGCKITTVTLSQEQYKYASDLFEREGLTDQVEIKLQDYRTLEGTFDKIVSIEMLEAVGHEYLPVYFKKCNELLRKGGIIALQVITSRDKRYREFRKDVDFIQKHIFPGSQTPSIEAVHHAVNAVSDLNLYDVKDIGLDYAKTLRLWYENFNRQLDEVKKLGMNEPFIRKWNYYLQYCEAAFQLKHISVMQLVYCKP